MIARSCVFSSMFTAAMYSVGSRSFHNVPNKTRFPDVLYLTGCICFGISLPKMYLVGSLAGNTPVPIMAVQLVPLSSFCHEALTGFVIQL